jgi:uncharacterized protein YcbK (DUF882 family)
VSDELAPGRYFTAVEFACHDGESYPVMFADRWIILRDLCDAIRGLWGGPLTVVSGYRSPSYNQGLIDADAASGVHGVASGSFHMIGQAADLRPALCTPDRVRQLHAAVLNAYEAGGLPNLGGLGIYEQSGWIHCDTHMADDGHLRRWVGK